jgi:hypothetical protein
MSEILARPRASAKTWGMALGRMPVSTYRTRVLHPGPRPERRWGLARLAGKAGGTVLTRILVPPPLAALIIDSFHLSQWSNVGVNYTLGANVFCKGATRGQKACMKML